MYPESIESERLLHEQLCHSNIDLKEFYQVCAHDDGIEEITEFMLWSPHENIKESKDFIDKAERKWEEGESLKYIIRPKSAEKGAGEIAGLTGLKFEWERRTAEEWIWLRKPFWGRGYNQESAITMMEVIFDHLDLDIYAVNHALENERSKRAVEKYIEAVGGRREGLLRNWVAHDDFIADEIRYTVSQEEWESYRF